MADWWIYRQISLSIYPFIFSNLAEGKTSSYYAERRMSLCNGSVPEQCREHHGNETLELEKLDYDIPQSFFLSLSTATELWFNWKHKACYSPWSDEQASYLPWRPWF